MDLKASNPISGPATMAGLRIGIGGATGHTSLCLNMS